MMLIALVRVGSITDPHGFEAICQSQPVDASTSSRTDEPFNCRTWLLDVLVRLDEDGVVRLPMSIGGFIHLEFLSSPTLYGKAKIPYKQKQTNWRMLGGTGLVSTPRWPRLEAALLLSKTLLLDSTLHHDCVEHREREREAVPPSSS